jgi:chromosome segregation and condensation protein ScpB
VLYATTPEFLQYFGISSLADLPPLNLDQRLPVPASGSSGGIFKE